MSAPKNHKGFTLIELLVTISIIGILAAVGIVVYSSVQKTARISKRVQDLNSMSTAIELFKTANGSYPSVTAAGTFICFESLSGNNAIAPSFMPTVPKDPIQSGTTNCYQYTSNGTGANPTATEYKLRTNIPNTEMAFNDLNQQRSLLDPAHDANTTNGCTIDTLTANVATQGWAFYTSTSTACAW